MTQSPNNGTRARVLPQPGPESPPAPGRPLLSVRGICKNFVSPKGTTVALSEIDLDVHEGEFLSLVGPSGCGKTTLLRIIDGLTEPDAGEIWLDGRQLRRGSTDMAFVFQDISLLPWRSVIENVAIGLEARGMSRPQRRARAHEALEMVGLAECADQPPYTLSGGMQQRVGVARALAVQPKVMLMDEPFGQLDNFTRETLQVEVAKLCERLRVTVVFVTHDVDEAIYLSDRIALFQRLPGRLSTIVAVGLPRPRSTFNVRAHPHAIALRSQVIEQLGVHQELTP